MRKILLNLFIILSFVLIGCTPYDTNPQIQPIKPNDITVGTANIELVVGDTFQIEVEVTPNDATYELIWEVNNDNVTVVDGLVTALKAGNSIITVSCKDVELYETINVVVLNPRHNIIFNLDGGTTESELPISYEQGVGIPELPIPIKNGYNFDGWYLNGEKIDSINPDISGDIEITAKWEEIIQDYDALAAEVDRLILALPSIIDYSDYDRVQAVKDKYASLPAASKIKVVYVELLADKLAALEEIENDVNTITYVLGEDIFTSKIELFNNFFGDFYKFIINRGGKEYLESKGIDSPETFLDIASDYDAGRGSMRHIGDVVGSYMLTKDVNGILENQPMDTFFGYCYQNGLYEDLLPFFIRFFAYWRIDERYANTTNYGADMFAESWAPTVDIAKFFHYDENTTYVKSERMLDCFLNISNVLYGELPTELKNKVILPTDIKLRGYIFEGWYDNPEFNGSPITEVSKNGEKVILYAKWGIDANQKDLEAAEMVKIYIYNLTTEPANVNRTTVGYVRNMYDALSDHAKTLVDNYNEFLSIEEEVLYFLTEPIVVNVKFEVERSFDDLKSEFLNDFNRITESSISSFGEFIYNRYGIMSKIGLFFKDKGMFIKWAFIIEGFLENEPARILKIQSNRILNNEGGDLEYVSKAIGYFFIQDDASNDGETLINFNDSNVINKILAEQFEIAVTFTIIQDLPVISINGYTFDGYYTSDNTKLEVVAVDMPTNLVIKFK